MAYTHIALSFLTGLMLFKFFEITWIIFIPLCILGSLLPDIDHENSKINKIIPATKIISKIFKHRGIFHTIFPVITILTIFYILKANFIGIPLAIGYTTHLISDGLTTSGINFLHPITKVHLTGFIKTNSMTEFIVFIAITSLSFYMIITNFF